MDFMNAGKPTQSGDYGRSGDDDYAIQNSLEPIEDLYLNLTRFKLLDKILLPLLQNLHLGDTCSGGREPAYSV